MTIRPIKTSTDYERALQRIEEIFDAKLGTVEGDQLEVLGILVDTYEKEHFPIESPTLQEAIEFRFEQLGMQQKDFAKLLGSKSRASEILSGKRKLSLAQIRKLHRELHIPAEILLEG